ncbi:hypothetical protein HLB23_03770 [Nocardia uniformis]|uniref:Uncharacterized protein n=1 Tax=Nocardia uniformis TaxID=53432 RepID=A0A849C1X2_9NOCA|nr:hypothetical protein [Nocardia uniformis]NNH68999.1 hypothetical protein [Nocardia uniformis]
MGSKPSNPPTYTESLGTKLDRLADALTTGHAIARADGVHVDVRTDGHVTAVHVDEDVFPGGRRLGPLLTRLLNEAREQARSQADDLVREAWTDPRVRDVVDQVGDAPERSLPAPVDPASARSASHDYGYSNPDDEDYSPLRPRSRISADDQW